MDWTKRGDKIKQIIVELEIRAIIKRRASRVSLMKLIEINTINRWSLNPIPNPNLLKPSTKI